MGLIFSCMGKSNKDKVSQEQAALRSAADDSSDYSIPAPPGGSREPRNRSFKVEEAYDMPDGSISMKVVLRDGRGNTSVKRVNFR